MAKRYKFAGKTGGFVPGLPEVIDLDEAKALGLEKTLEECIASGLYTVLVSKDKEVKPPAKKKEK